MYRDSGRPRLCFFVGPSIRADEVLEELGGVQAEVLILPPVQQGDLLRLHERLPDVIGIIDGYFYQVPAVYHKEILYTMERGAAVLGAASLGALRAAELDSFGMEGIGEVYRLYKRGTIDGDDEVALVHLDEDEDFRPLTIPLVTIRHNLQRARARRLISAGTAAAVLASAKRLRFAQRSYRAALGGVPAGAAPSEELALLADFFSRQAIDIKHADARALVRTVAERVRGQQPWPARSAIAVQRTTYLHRHQEQYLCHTFEGIQVPAHLALTLHKLFAPSFPRLLRRVALRCLAGDEARHRGLGVEDPGPLLARFRHRERLEADAAFAGWLDARRLSIEELRAALHARALELRLVAHYRQAFPELSSPALIYRRLVEDVSSRTGIDAATLTQTPLMHPGLAWHEPILSELKLRGRFGAALELAADIIAHNDRLAARFPDFMQHLAPRGLERWFATRWGVEVADLPAALQRRGFTHHAEFLHAARTAYVYDGLAVRRQTAAAS